MLGFLSCIAFFLSHGHGFHREEKFVFLRKAAETVWTKNSNQTIAVLNYIYTFSEHRPENKELIYLICNIVKQAVDIFDTDIGEGI